MKRATTFIYKRMTNITTQHTLLSLLSKIKATHDQKRALTLNIIPRFLTINY